MRAVAVFVFVFVFTRSTEHESESEDVFLVGATNAGWRTSYGLAVVELEIPIEIVAPALGRVSKADRNADGRRRIRPPRRRDQTHVRLFRRTSTLPAVA